MPENLSRLPDQLFTLMTDPASNLPAAFMLYGILGGVLLIVLLGAIMFLMGSEEDIDEYADDEADGDDTESPVAAEEVPAQSAAAPTPAPAPKSAKRTLLTLGFWFAVVVLVLVAAGFATSSPDVCLSCHADNPHVASQVESNPHESVGCIKCHESGGPLANYTTGVFTRSVHYVVGWVDLESAGDYGRVTTSACTRCHEPSLQGVTLNKARGLKMSHTEPLAARARCLDCHQSKDGVVGPYNAGMNPCITCHDSKQASSECSTCHDAKASAAARASSTAMAKVQVPEVRCGGCHNEKQECDSCHGVRMPHSKNFKRFAHARAGALSLWDDNGETCGKCHTATRRPCTQCHTWLLGKGHPDTQKQHHQVATEVGCNTCHHVNAYLPNRDFCKDLCHSPAALEGSP